MTIPVKPGDRARARPWGWGNSASESPDAEPFEGDPSPMQGTYTVVYVDPSGAPPRDKHMIDGVEIDVNTLEPVTAKQV